jgi:hypothetical protein
MKRLNSGFLNDLYRDLRDRRLLLPMAALAVAIVAVPMLIGGSSEATTPPPLASPVDADGAEVASAVLTSDPGVRDYRKRLAKLKESNPFAQKFALPDPEKTALESVGGSSGSTDSTSTGSVNATNSGGSGDITSTTITDSVTDTSTSTSTLSAPQSSSTVSEATQTTETTTDQPKPEARFYAGRIDVTVGELGDAKRVDGVRYLQLLPSEGRPVVAFLGLAHGGEGAVFSLSRDVVETAGDGSCAPKRPAPCQFLTLKVGDQATFKYADGTTFRLTVRDTEIVRVPDPRQQQAADQANADAD